MTDEEVLNLLADSKIQSVLKVARKSTPWGSDAADAIAKFAGRLGIHFFFYWCPCSLDDRQCRAGIQGI